MKPFVFIMSSLHSWDDGRIFYREALSLSEKYEITYCGIGDFDFKEVENISIYGLPERKEIIKRPLNWFKLLRMALRTQASVYHFHDPELILVGIIIKLLKKNSKIIYDVHENVSATIQGKIWIPKFFRRIVTYLWPIFEVYFVRFIDGVVAASEDISTKFQKFQDKVVVIRNFPYKFHRCDDSNLVERKYSVCNNSFTLIYTGSLMRAKGILEIVKAIKYVDKSYNIKLVLTNDFRDSDFEKEVKNIADDRVIFTGRLSYRRVYEYIRMSDVGLACYHPIPNYVNGINRMLKIFEYMLMGLPIIISNFPQWKDFVARHQCGISVDPMDPRAIAKAIERLISYPEEKVKMGENGKKAVMEKYNWEMESQKLVRFYEKLLK